jgi:hypothetical protein
MQLKGPGQSRIRVLRDPPEGRLQKRRDYVRTPGADDDLVGLGGTADLELGGSVVMGFERGELRGEE